MAWKRRHDPVYQRGLARLGHNHKRGQRKCEECDRFLRQLAQENGKELES